MAKIVTVWGNPGSGKSMFSAILAKALTKSRQKAIIISPDYSTPMLPVWLPDHIVETSSSVGQLLTALELDKAQVAAAVQVLKSYPFIGLLGYAAEENPLTYPEQDYDSILKLIQIAGSLVDYVLIDCPSDLTNYFVPTAIENADLSIRILTPDLKGINYLKSHSSLLSDPRFRFDEHLTFAGLARPYHAVVEMAHLIGGFDGLLPYNKEVDRCMTAGSMFHAAQYCNSRYTSAVKKACDKILEIQEVSNEK